MGRIQIDVLARVAYHPAANSRTNPTVSTESPIPHLPSLTIIPCQERNYSMRNRLSIFLCCLWVAVGLYVSGGTHTALAATYEVGPGKAYVNIGDVPWESLQPSDTVLIYWRSTPYKEKWVICRQGTASAPIT